MKTKCKIQKIMLALIFCFVVMSVTMSDVFAAVAYRPGVSLTEAMENLNVGAQAYTPPLVTKDELPKVKGEKVTGNDIIQTALYLCNVPNFTYSNVGTCTGFVTRVLRYLEINKNLAAGGHASWDAFYTLDNWDVPGIRGEYGAPYYPSAYRKYALNTVTESFYVGMIDVKDGKVIGWVDGATNKRTNCSYDQLDKLEVIKSGDLLVTPEYWPKDYPDNWPADLPPCPDYDPSDPGKEHTSHIGKPCKNGHVAFAYILDNKHITSVGAGGSSIAPYDLVSVQSDKQGDIYVYRLAPDVITGCITITKTQSATSVTEKKNLAGVQFTATSLDDPSLVYTSTISGEDGSCLIDGVLGGRYRISETMCPDTVVKVDDFEAEITVNGQELHYDIEDPTKTIRVTVEKKYAQHVLGKTDAKLSGAEFTIYSDEACTNEVTSFITDATGRGVSDPIPTGNYWMKETVFPEGMYPDAINPDTGKSYRDTVYEIRSDASTQNVVVAYPNSSIVNDSIYGKVKVKKQQNSSDGTEVSPAEGAVLKLTLKSSIGKAKEVSYTATVDKNGECEFINEEVKALGYESTIPYGSYVLSEVKESDNGEHYFYYIQSHDIAVKVQNQISSAIVSDDIVPFYPKIRKIDKDTGEQVHMAGFKYKIWQLENKELGFKAGWVSQFDPSSNSIIDEFVTNETGTVVLPDKLKAGKYVFYEIDCPDDYYIPEKYRLPANEADYGNYEVSGVYVDATKSVLYIPEDQVATQEDKYLEVPMKDPQLKGKISLYKTGEVLSDVSFRSDEITKEEIYTPKYEIKPLEGISFKVYANEDIYSPDKRIKLYSKDEYIETITTESDGYATSKDLFLGEYRLEEIPQKGYKTCDDIIVKLENEDKNNEVQVTPVTVENTRQQLYVKIKKIFEESKYNDIDLSDKSAIFTVRTKEPILNYQGNVIIPEGKLVSVIEFTDNHQISEDVDLPAGKYEIEEIYASEPYERITEKKIVVLEGDTSGKTEVSFEEEFINDYIKKDLYFIKFSASSFADADATGLVGERVNKDLVDSEIAKFVESVRGMTPEQVSALIEQKAWITKEGAKYAIYKDKACTDPLINKDTKEAIVIQTGINGMYNLSDIAEGVYYVKEINAPVYTDGEIEIPYQVTEEPVRIDLSEEADSSTSNMVFRGLWDEAVVYPAVEKTDIFTGDAVPNCTFEVLDSTTRKVIYHATTNAKGVAGIPIDKLEKGKEYIFKEISAPSVYNENGVLYELNTAEHKFVADYEVVEGKIVFKNKLHIDNYRPTSTVKLIKVDADSGELIPNCKFELRSKEKEDFVIIGVTDEHGEYVFENVPYGEYTFTELEAPEEYMIDTTPHDVTVDSETMDIRVPNTLEPDSPKTGDINVVALSLMAVVSMLVISYVIVKNRKVRE